MKRSCFLCGATQRKDFSNRQWGKAKCLEGRCIACISNDSFTVGKQQNPTRKQKEANVPANRKRLPVRKCTRASRTGSPQFTNPRPVDPLYVSAASTRVYPGTRSPTPAPKFTAARHAPGSAHIRRWSRLESVTQQRGADMPARHITVEKNTDKNRREAEINRQENDWNYGRGLSVAFDQHCGAYRKVTKFVSKFVNPAQQLSHNHQWRPSEYFVSEQADGPRCLVLCSCDGHVWCLRRKNYSRKLSTSLAFSTLSTLLPEHVCKFRCLFLLFFSVDILSFLSIFLFLYIFVVVVLLLSVCLSVCLFHVGMLLNSKSQTPIFCITRALG